MIDDKEVDMIENLAEQVCRALEIEPKQLFNASKMDRKVCFAKHMVIYIANKHLKSEKIRKPDVLKKILNYENKCVVPITIKKVIEEMGGNAAYRKKSIELLMKIVPNSDVKVPVFNPVKKVRAKYRTTSFFD